MEVVYEDATSFSQVVNKDCREIQQYVRMPPPEAGGWAKTILTWCLPLAVLLGTAGVTWHRVAYRVDCSPELAFAQRSDLTGGCSLGHDTLPEG